MLNTEKQTIVFATHNENKVKEIHDIMKDIPIHNKIDIISLRDAGIYDDIEETGETYEQNAIIKAKFATEKTGLPAFADDSGLEIRALNNKPGIYSARYLGEDTPYDVKMEHILAELKNKDRFACYKCAIAFVTPIGNVTTSMGILNGNIAFERSNGPYGFAYDKIFYIPDYQKTFADLPPEIKNKISHRAMALRNLFNHYVTI